MPSHMDGAVSLLGLDSLIRRRYVGDFELQPSSVEALLVVQLMDVLS